MCGESVIIFYKSSFSIKALNPLFISLSSTFCPGSRLLFNLILVFDIQNLKKIFPVGYISIFSYDFFLGFMDSKIIIIVMVAKVFLASGYINIYQCFCSFLLIPFRIYLCYSRK